MTSIRPNITILLILIAFTLISCRSKRDTEANRFTSHKVIKVIDGDTFWAEDDNNNQFKVRLIGIDAPETRNVFGRLAGHFGPESRDYLRELIDEKDVRLEFDVDSLDRYGRTLAYVFLEDGTFVNAQLVKYGYAVLMTFPPNVKYANLFVSLQAEARRKERGLWEE